jgi:hypothetical protein
MPLPLTKIISGGQTGVDQVGLAVAQALHYATGGTMPKGWRTSEGPDRQLAVDYGLKESWSPGYRVRTRQNVIDSDFTVWFGDPHSPGGKLTLQCCQALNKRYMINPTAGELRAALERYEVKVLNVAGNRLWTNPQASEQARAVLREALTR